MELKSASNNPVIRLKAVPRALLMALLHYYFNPTVRLSVCLSARWRHTEPCSDLLDSDVTRWSIQAESDSAYCTVHVDFTTSYTSWYPPPPAVYPIDLFRNSINRIKGRSASGWDMILAWVLKYSLNALLSPCLHVRILKYPNGAVSEGA